MSDTAICMIHGTCKEISEKNGWTTFSVAVEGMEYPFKLQTKREEIIEAARAVGGAEASWKYEFSLGQENPRRPGTHYKNRRLEAVVLGFQGSPVREPDLEPGAASGQTSMPVPGGLGPQHVDENVNWDEKERRSYNSKAWAHTLTALQHTQRADEDPDAFFARLQSFQRKIYNDICGAWGEHSPEYYPAALRPAPETTTATPVEQPAQETIPQDDWQPSPDDDIPF